MKGMYIRLPETTWVSIPGMEEGAELEFTV